MEHVERLKRMEAHLNEVAPIVRQMLDTVEQFAAVQPKLRELSAYYGSKDWQQDLADYDAGKLPKDIRCGVLSEDGIYNVLMDNREATITMLETVTEIMRQT